jgi:hypothetical protein
MRRCRLDPSSILIFFFFFFCKLCVPFSQARTPRKFSTSTLLSLSLSLSLSTPHELTVLGLAEIPKTKQVPCSEQSRMTDPQEAS